MKEISNETIAEFINAVALFQAFRVEDTAALD